MTGFTNIQDYYGMQMIMVMPMRCRALIADEYNMCCSVQQLGKIVDE